MSGWAAAITIVVLMTVAVIGFNASLWLRHRALAAARGGWSEADFSSAMAAAGVSPEVTEAVRSILGDYYMADLAPQPDDDLADVLRISSEEQEEIVERLFTALGRPEPIREVPEHIPDLRTVEDLALHMQRRRDALAATH
ncbi:hypothetical protein [Sphingomonas sp. RS2018]